MIAPFPGSPFLHLSTETQTKTCTCNELKAFMQGGEPGNKANYMYVYTGRDKAIYMYIHVVECCRVSVSTE